MSATGSQNKHQKFQIKGAVCSKRCFAIRARILSAWRCKTSSVQSESASTSCAGDVGTWNGVTGRRPGGGNGVAVVAWKRQRQQPC
eukprot:6172768-Pleurochrysis_carterae.AAC.3